MGFHLVIKYILDTTMPYFQSDTCTCVRCGRFCKLVSNIDLSAEKRIKVQTEVENTVYLMQVSCGGMEAALADLHL